jgi:hypothetical protein
VVLALTVHVNGEGQVLAGFEEINFLLQEQGVGAEIDVFFAGYEAFYDFPDLRVEQRFSAGDRYGRGSAFICRSEAILRSELHSQDVAGILDFSATGAGQVAAEEGLEHEDERVLLAPP